nr:hypothetical transcript [Hymenolepis microstoma]
MTLGKLRLHFVITITLLLSLVWADCSCKKEAENALVRATAEAQTAPKRALGRHTANSFGDVLRSGGGGGSRLPMSEVEARSKGFSVKLDS